MNGPHLLPSIVSKACSGDNDDDLEKKVTIAAVGYSF